MSKTKDLFFQKLLFIFVFFFSLFFSFSPSFAFDSQYGLFERVTGSVYLIDSESQTKISVEKGMSIHPENEIICSEGSETEIKMEDGSQILLTSNSHLQIGKKEIAFPSYESQSNNSKKPSRIIFKIPYYILLLAGKIRTRFQKDNPNNLEDKSSETEEEKGPKTRTYQVRTKTAVIGVRGTDFLTSYDKDISSTRVSLFEGEVLFFPIEESSKSFLPPFSITTGEQLIYVYGQPPSPPILLNTDTINQLKEEVKFKTPPTNSFSKHKDTSPREPASSSSEETREPFLENPTQLSSDAQKSLLTPSPLSLPEDFEINENFLPKEDPWLDLIQQNQGGGTIKPQSFSNCLSFSCRLEQRNPKLPPQSIRLSIQAFHKDKQ